ncbi:hypothetical protein [Bacteroides sp. AM10-21B]|nr:hypothetical protein [Bacteroides sp. AM10-21B]
MVVRSYTYYNIDTRHDNRVGKVYLAITTMDNRYIVVPQAASFEKTIVL